MDVANLPQPLVQALAAVTLRTIQYDARDMESISLPDGSGATALSSAVDLLTRKPFLSSWTIPEHLMFQAVLRAHTRSALDGGSLTPAGTQSQLQASSQPTAALPPATRKTDPDFGITF